MKFRTFCRITAAIAVLSSSYGLAETVTLRADTWCPFNCDPESDLPGYFIEIAKAALEPAGHKIEYANLNWARAISEARDGKYVGIVGAAKSDAPDFTYPEVSMGKANNCFFTKPDSKWNFSGEASLSEVIIGSVKDYTYGEPVDSYIVKNAKDSKKVDVVAGDAPLELNIKKLQAGRIGAVLESDFVFRSYLFSKKMPENSFRKAGCLKEGDDLFIAFGPKAANGKVLAKLIGDKVTAMRKDGSLAKLLARYGVSDWTK
jgi:polar amino acid transport system substrate-binding protein